MIITPHYRQYTLRIYRRNDPLSIMANNPGIFTVFRTVSNIGNHNDIRPSKPKWNGIVEHMRELCKLPDIVMPCTAYRNPWWIKANREYMSNFFLPEFG